MTHVSVYVLNLDSAYDFYVNKLGFIVINDVTTPDGGRWLTVSPLQQPGFELILWPVKTSNEFSGDTVAALQHLIAKGTFGVGLLTSNDVLATYQELKQKGVEFIKAPTKEVHGTEAVFKDDSGNWFTLVQFD
jgi:catechol 2,3-dioxygenase-like lactoylglutathione lyase family enzyme